MCKWEDCREDSVRSEHYCAAHLGPRESGKPTDVATVEILALRTYSAAVILKQQVFTKQELLALIAMLTKAADTLPE
jgi:hypothetical protein